MGRGAFMTNRLAKGYAKQPIADQASYEKKLAISRRYFTPESEVLEIGCGTGSTALLHAPYVKHIDGLDYASKMIEIASDKAGAAAVENVSFRVGEIDDLPKIDKQYDVLLALNVMHLLEDKEIALKHIYALLKPGGYFISSTVCMRVAEVPLRWRLLLKPFMFLGLMPRITGFGEQEYVESVKAAGFQVVEQWNPEGKWVVVFLVAQKPAE